MPTDGRKARIAQPVRTMSGQLSITEVAKLQQVAIIGRLASMTRGEAARALAARGSELADRVTRSTSTVVLGSRGPQLLRSGRVPPQLARARHLVEQGLSLKILSEAQWLASLGIADTGGAISKRYTAGQMAEALSIPRLRLDRWLAAGLVQPVEEAAGVPLFDFRQVSACRTLAELLQSGISLVRVRRALAGVAQWLPEISQPLVDLCVSQDARRLIVRRPDGREAEASGQLLMDFGATDETPAITYHRTETLSDAFRRALALEEEQPLAAAEAYRKMVVDYGPSPTLAFNLANSLYAAGEVSAALVHFREATTLDPAHAPSWNNLANILAELDQLEEAVVAYRRALSLDPAFTDARFNVAQTLVELGRPEEATLHWRAYLAADADSSWADYARERLEACGT